MPNLGNLHRRLDFDLEVAGASVKGRADTYLLTAYMTRQSDAGWYVDAIMGTGLLNGAMHTTIRTHKLFTRQRVV